MRRHEKGKRWFANEVVVRGDKADTAISISMSSRDRAVVKRLAAKVKALIAEDGGSP